MDLFRRMAGMMLPTIVMEESAADMSTAISEDDCDSISRKESDEVKSTNTSKSSKVKPLQSEDPEGVLKSDFSAALSVPAGAVDNNIRNMSPFMLDEGLTMSAQHAAHFSPFGSVAGQESLSSGFVSLHLPFSLRSGFCAPSGSGFFTIVTKNNFLPRKSNADGRKFGVMDSVNGTNVAKQRVASPAGVDEQAGVRDPPASHPVAADEHEMVAHADQPSDLKQKVVLHDSDDSMKGGGEPAVEPSRVSTSAATTSNSPPQHTTAASTSPAVAYNLQSTTIPSLVPTDAEEHAFGVGQGSLANSALHAAVASWQAAPAIVSHALRVADLTAQHSRVASPTAAANNDGLATAGLKRARTQAMLCPTEVPAPDRTGSWKMMKAAGTKWKLCAEEEINPIDYILLSDLVYFPKPRAIPQSRSVTAAYRLHLQTAARIMLKDESANLARYAAYLGEQSIAAIKDMYFKPDALATVLEVLVTEGVISGIPRLSALLRRDASLSVRHMDSFFHGKLLKSCQEIRLIASAKALGMDIDWNFEGDILPRYGVVPYILEGTISCEVNNRTAITGWEWGNKDAIIHLLHDGVICARLTTDVRKFRY